MSEETVWRLKIGTVAAVLLGIISVMGTVMSVWVNNISLKVASHGEAIARMDESQRNTVTALGRMENLLEEIRKEQIKRAR